jgi:hypothetical protein
MCLQAAGLPVDHLSRVRNNLSRRLPARLKLKPSLPLLPERPPIARRSRLAPADLLRRSVKPQEKRDDL